MRRENFDETIDRETISVQNIDFFDVAVDVKKNVDIAISDSANFAFDVSENENFEFVFADVLDDVNINADSFDDKNFVFSILCALENSHFSHLLIENILFLLVNFISSATSCKS